MPESLVRVSKMSYRKAWLGVLAVWLLIATAAFAQDPWVEIDADGQVRVHLYISSGRKPARIA